MNSKTKFGAIVFSGLALAGLVASAALAAPARQAAAQGATQGTAQATPQAGTGTGSANQANPRQANGQSRQQYLATALGITTDALQKAETAAHQAAIKAALAAGQITQAQADALLAGQRGPRIDYQAANINPEKLLADALNITVDKLQAAEQAAFKAELAEAVTDGRMTQAQADLALGRQALDKYIQDKGLYTSAVQAAVKDGVLTQAQADALLKQAQNAGSRGFGFGPGGFGGGPGFGPEGFGGGRGHGHGGPGFGQPPANGSSSQTPGTGSATPSTGTSGGSGA